jgi:hypothetical protein
MEPDEPEWAHGTKRVLQGMLRNRPKSTGIVIENGTVAAMANFSFGVVGLYVLLLFIRPTRPVITSLAVVPSSLRLIRNHPMPTISRPFAITYFSLNSLTSWHSLDPTAWLKWNNTCDAKNVCH